MTDPPIQVEVLRAWPRGYEQTTLTLPAGTTVAAALAACRWRPDPATPCAVYGERVAATTMLRDGDRLELLRPLLIDPKQARRRRAAKP